MKHKTKSESGQALVLVLLSLSVVLTIVLYILSRSVTDISTSTKQTDSVRAFSAAEAGIENALITGAGTNGSSVTIGGSTYTVDVADASSGSLTFNYPVSLSSGDSMTLWFTSHKDDGSLFCGDGYPCFTGNALKVCWGNPGTSASTGYTPALELSVYYKSSPGSNDFSTVQIARAGFDPNSSRASSNAFLLTDAGTCTINGVSYPFQKTINFSDLGISSSVYGTEGGLLFAKLRLIYNTDQDHVIGAAVFSAEGLPSQGINVVSTGTSGSIGQESNRKISVFQSWPEFPFGGLSIYYPYGITK